MNQLGRRSSSTQVSHSSSSISKIWPVRKLQLQLWKEPKEAFLLASFFFPALRYRWLLNKILLLLLSLKPGWAMCMMSLHLLYAHQVSGYGIVHRRRGGEAELLEGTWKRAFLVVTPHSCHSACSDAHLASSLTVLGTEWSQNSLFVYLSYLYPAFPFHNQESQSGSQVK